MQLLSVRLCLSIAAVEEDQGTSNQWCVECFQCNNRKNVFLAFSAYFRMPIWVKYDAISKSF